MTLLIDNYDSFSYNLYQYVGELAEELSVVRNDEVTVEDIEGMEVDHIILSPGPGRPEDAGAMLEIIRAFAGRIPILGVCLGHQGISMALGGQVGYAKELCHGKQYQVKVDRTCPIFQGCPQEMPVARYHSLAVQEEGLPEELVVTARTEDGEIMGVMHREDPVYGLQFHPESILTPYGKQMIANFLKI